MTVSTHIPLDDAKDIIIKALSAFDDDLGQRAFDILHNVNCLADVKSANIIETDDPEKKMMQCRPAGIENEDWNRDPQNEMYIPDFEEQYGPDFKTQENPQSYAIIDLHYHGTPEDVMWLSHELGHAIADAIQNENGKSFRDFAPNEMEAQAYFIQNIVERYITANADKLSINPGDLQGARPKPNVSGRSLQFNSAVHNLNQVIASSAADRLAAIQTALGKPPSA